MTSVDLSTLGKQGSGAGLIQTYDYGDIDGSNFTITQHLEPTPNSNYRTPFVNGTTGGWTQFSAGPRVNTSETLGYFRVRLVSNRALDSIDWAARGIANVSTTEDISFISNSGTSSNLGSSSTGTVSWANLPENTFEVYFDVVSSSDGNNSGYGRPDTGTAVLATGGGGGETYIRAGTIHVEGTATEPGVHTSEVTVFDSNGPVGVVSVRFEVDPGDEPVLTTPGNLTNVVGDAVNLQLASTSPEGYTLTYSADHLPDGLTMTTAGLISGTISDNGNHKIELSVSDQYGQCDTVIIDWDVTGGDPNSLDDLTPPVLVGRRGTTAGPWEQLNPSESRNLLDVYNKSEVESLDDVVISTLRDSVIDDLNTLKKLATSLEGRTNAVTYLRGLIQDSGSDLTNIHSILGVNPTDTSLQDFSDIVTDNSSVNSAIQQLITYVIANTGGGGSPTLSQNTVYGRIASGSGAGTALTAAEIRTLISAYTQSQVDNLLSAKAALTVVNSLITLSGVDQNSTSLGTFSDVIQTNATIKEAFEDLVTAVVALQNGGGSGTVTLNSQSLLGRTASGTGPGTSLDAGQVRSLLSVSTTAEMNAALALKGAKSVSDALVEITGRPSGSLRMGTFTGSTISDDRTIHEALQQLETGQESIKAGGLDIPVWSPLTLSSTHTARNWQMSINVYLRRGASGDTCFIRGQLERSTGSGGTNTLLENTNLFTSAIDSDLRPTFDFRFNIMGAGSSTTRNREGQIQVLTTGHMKFFGDQSSSTYIWDFYGSWPVGGTLIA